jgi:hypothetical protein
MAKYVDSRFAEYEKARTMALSTLEQRLDQLDHLHAQLQHREVTFYSRDQHEQYAKDVELKVSRALDAVHEASRPNWQILLLAMSVVLTLMSAMYYVTIVPLSTQVSALLSNNSKQDQDLVAIKERQNRNTDAISKINADREARDGDIEKRINELRDLNLHHSESMRAIEDMLSRHDLNTKDWTRRR